MCACAVREEALIFVCAACEVELIDSGDDAATEQWWVGEEEAQHTKAGSLVGESRRTKLRPTVASRLIVPGRHGMPRELGVLCLGRQPSPQASTI